MIRHRNRPIIDHELALLLESPGEIASRIIACELSETDCLALNAALPTPREQVAVWETRSSVRRDYGVSRFKKGGRHNAQRVAA